MWTRLVLVAAVAVTVLGCAQDVGDIDRRQTGLLAKSLFEGEWYLRRTVIDVPYDAGYTFIGETDELVRIRWEIQKENLIAMRSHPLIEGGTGAAPLAVFAIDDHVDAIRDYNPSTGEQTNVVREDSQDRVWYERDFIRVDWSKNLVQNYVFYVDGLATEPVAWTVEAEDDENRVLIGRRNELGEWEDEQDPMRLGSFESADYIDVVTKMLVSPETFDVEDWDGTTWTEPACWYYLNYDCAPAIIAVRNSFLRVDAAKTDYAPLEYPDNRIARDDQGAVFVGWNSDGNLSRIDGGVVSVDLAAATDFAPDDPYAPSPKSPVRLPFFDKFGYFRTERYSYDEQYGELQSDREQFIQRWNIWEKSHAEDGSVLPYGERGYRPVVYYLSPDFPDWLLPAADKAVDQWNDALRETATAVVGAADPPRLFELRPNSREVDPETGQVIRRGEVIGDLRYSHLYLVTTPTRAGLLGYGPAAADPLTGEIIAADAYIYFDAVKRLGAKGRDIVQLINGEIDPVDLALGEHVRGYLDKLASSGAPLQAPSFAELSEFSDKHPLPSGAAKPAGGNKGGAKGGANTKKFPTKASTPPAQYLRPAGWADAKLSHVRDTALEELLAADPEILRMRSLGMSNDPKTLADLSAAARQGASPAHWASPARRKRSLHRMRFFSERNMMKAEFFDDAVAGLALDMLGRDPEVIWQELMIHIFRSTAEHEVGHTLGLRHNFEGSTDALNYHDEYWNLRGDSPEPLSAMTAEESEGSLREYQYSSIMDYAGRFNADTAGLGLYDYAAIKFGYGQLVEVFANAPDEPLVGLTEVGEGEFTRLFTLDKVLRDYRHYTSYPAMFGGQAAIRERKDVPYTDDNAVLMRKSASESLESQLTGRAAWSSWEVPYRFCSDEYVFGTKTCYMYDMGADAYEIVADAVQRFWSYYWFNSFQRDQVFFDEWSYMDSMYWRYFSFIHSQYQHWVFDEWFDAPVFDWLATTPEEYGLSGDSWRTAVDGGLAGTAAAREGLKFLQQVLAIPEPGSYWYDFDEGYYWSFSDQDYPLCDEEWAWYSENYCSDSVIDLGDGRYFLTVYDWESGYAFYERLKWVGSFYDKLLALETLTNPETYFLGVDTSQSLDQWALSMNLAFPEEIHRIFAGVAADRFDLFGGWIEEERWSYQPPNPYETNEEIKALAAESAVDPQTSFTIQLYALWYGMAWLNANYDNRFNDQAKVWIQGSGEGFTPPEGTETLLYTDPFNHRTYVTLAAVEGERLGVGASLLEQANLAVEQWQAALDDPEIDPSYVEYYKWKIENFTSNIEVVRGLHSMYGTLFF